MSKLSGKTSGPLAGLIVVDLTRVLAGPYCTQQLADLGARVIKVEIPQVGDDARGVGPFLRGKKGSVPDSAYFFSVNRNKESIALNLKDAEDRTIFERLLVSADVLVENYRPGTMERLGYGWEFLHRRWPQLILASISGFGQTGPYRDYPAYDIVVQAMSGLMSLTGSEGGEPTRVGVSIGDLAAGVFCATGVLAALLERGQTGKGRHVDISMLDCQVALLENAMARYQLDGQSPGPIGSRHPSISPFAAFRALDGHLVIAAGNDATFADLCDALDVPEMKSDPRFVINARRTENHVELAAAIEARLMRQSVEEWLACLRRAGVPCAPLNDIAAVMKDPQVLSRNMLIQLSASDGAKLVVAGTPIKFVGDLPVDFTPAPSLDQHGQSLREELAADRSAVLLSVGDLAENLSAIGKEQ